MENITEYFVHAQTVCTRPLLTSGEGTRLDMNEIESVEGCYAADLKVEMFSTTVSS